MKLGIKVKYSGERIYFDDLGTGGGFGQPAQQSGGLFGSTATTQAGGLFSGQPSTTFGATGKGHLHIWLLFEQNR